MIGILDSGFGGLVFLRHFRQEFSEYDTVYFSDTASALYEDLSEELLIDRMRKGIQFLQEKGAKVIILSGSQGWESGNDNPVLKYGVIDSDIQFFSPVSSSIKNALQASRFGRIGFLNSNSDASDWEDILEQVKDEFYSPSENRAFETPRLYPVSCPLLSALILEKYVKKPETRMILKKTLIPLKHAHVDTLILGKMEYALVASEIQAKLPKHCQVIDPSVSLLQEVSDYLTDADESFQKNGKMEFFVTDNPQKFEEKVPQYYGQKIKKGSVEIAVLGA